MMARRAHVYPQVEPGAAALATGVIARLDRGASVATALRTARKRDAIVLSIGEAFILREDLVRAEALGLHDLRAAALTRPLPEIAATRSEIEVRRELAGGAPVVIVTERARPIGAVSAGAVGSGAPVSMKARLERRLPAPVRDALRVVGDLAAARGMRAYLVGGLVRDPWLDVPFRTNDLDVVIEGDAPALAGTVAAALGGSLRVHERFLTASVDTPSVGRIDLITSRSERYERRGELPRVMPAGIQQDLRRRDFTINAMAVELGTSSMDLLDPMGGRNDLTRKRLRVLHPLSFVEDPTRIFRAARYAARLGFALDRWTMRCQALALELVPYPALSGQRIVAELERIVAEADPALAFGQLGRAGAFRLLDARSRFSAGARARLAALAAARDWAVERGRAADGVELAVLSLLTGQPPDVARAVVRRLGFAGEPLERLERMRETSTEVGSRLLGAASASARVKALDDQDGTGLAWLWLDGDGARRAALDRATREAETAGPVLRGNDLMALGVPRGPAVARVLEQLREARLDGRVCDREAETALVRQWLRMPDPDSFTAKEG